MLTVFKRIVKKALIALLAIGMAPPVFAVSYADWYAGTYKSSFYIAPTVLYTNLYIDKVTFQGITPRLAVGYDGMATKYVYLAGELFANLATATLKNHPAPAGSLKTSYSYGAAVLPGYPFDDSVLGYLRIGYIATRFENLHTTKAGYEVGAGFELGWTECWSVRAEYNYLKYRTIPNVGGPRAQQVNVALKYKFL